MAFSSTTAEFPAAETLHQLPDDQFAQALIDGGVLKQLSAKALRKSEAPLGEKLAERLQTDWIKSGLVKRAHRILPADAVAWSAEAIDPPVLNVSDDSDFRTALEELTKLTSSPTRVSSKRRVRLSKQLYECLNFLGTGQSDFTAISAYQLLRITEIFLKGGAVWSPAEFWELYRCIATQFLHLQATVDDYAGAGATPVQAVIVAGELPWLAGLLFKNSQDFQEFGKAGRKVLKSSLKEQLDSDGTPSAVLMDHLADWLAPLVRGHLWGEVFDRPIWKKKQAELYDLLLEHASMLCRPSGRLVLSGEGKWSHAGMLQCALRQSGYASSSKPLKYVTSIATTAVESRNGLVVKSRKWGNVKNSISSQSDWAETALLRTNWALDADLLFVAHDSVIPRLEMSVSGNRLLEGAWEVDVLINGEKQNLTGEWECSCWYSDREVDYLEISLPIAEGIVLNRQMALSRKDQFALIMESVSYAGEKQVELRSRVPFAEGVEKKPEQTTREWRLKAGRHPVRLFPLDEPQFKTHKTDGDLLCPDGILEQAQKNTGGAMNALFIDWHPRRSRERVEWRTLSITENRRPVPPGEAFAARIRLKNRQWLIYRALKSGWEWPRAVLGLHTNYETVFGLVDSRGDIEPLVNVE